MTSFVNKNMRKLPVVDINTEQLFVSTDNNTDDTSFEPGLMLNGITENKLFQGHLRKSMEFKQNLDHEVAKQIERLQQEKHDLLQKCRGYEVQTNELFLELQNLQKEFQTSTEHNLEIIEEKNRYIAATEEKYRCLQDEISVINGDRILQGKKFDNAVKKEEKYKKRIASLQNILTEYKEQCSELEKQSSERERLIIQFMTERENMLTEIEKSRTDTELLLSHNQNLETQAIVNNDELQVTRESLSHLQKQYELQVLRNSMSVQADEISLMDELGVEEILGNSIHMTLNGCDSYNNTVNSADEETVDMPSYSESLAPPSTMLADMNHTQTGTSADYQHVIEKRFNRIEKQLSDKRDECLNLESELFAIRGQVRLREKERDEIIERLRLCDLDRDRLKNKVNKAKLKLSNFSNEKSLLTSRYQNLENENKKHLSENSKLELQLLHLIQQKINLVEQLSQYEVDFTSFILTTDTSKCSYDSDHTDDNSKITSDDNNNSKENEFT